MKSMTGYGSSQVKGKDFEISIVIKAVNGRFLEPRFHLPKEYFAFESLLKKKLMSKFRRGTVDVYIHRTGNSAVDIKINSEAAKRWLTAHQKLASSLKLNVNDDLLMERLMSLPHIFNLHDPHEISKNEKTNFEKAFVVAMEKCNEERKREGQSLKRHLVQIISDLVKSVDHMEVLRQKLKTELSQRLNTRLQKAGLEGQLDPARFAQEVIIYLDKGDVAEEIERLKEHLNMCLELLKTPEAQGKKLDFYTQELLREVNTIGSKANNAELTEQVVRAKGLIESFKEQVQNIE